MKTAQEMVSTRNWTKYTAIELVGLGRSTPEEMANQLMQAYSKELSDTGGLVPLDRIKEHIAQMEALKEDVLSLLSTVY